MSSFTQLETLLKNAGLAVHSGYPSTGAKLPYVVTRPLIIDPEELAISGDGMGWDLQFSVYCCAGSVEASFNLGVTVMQTLQGNKIGGNVMSTSMGYSGAALEGKYETQVTVQLGQGVIQ